MYLLFERGVGDMPSGIGCNSSNLKEKNLLFFNLEIVLELMGSSEKDLGNNSKLKYYDVIAETKLEEDLAYSKEFREEEIVNYLCNLEICNKSLIGRNINGELRKGLRLLEERERDFFTKLFVRDYLQELGIMQDTTLVSQVGVMTLFSDFASEELKNSSLFAGVILRLNGKYIGAMGKRVQDSELLMKLALENDSSKDVDCFSKSTSKLRYSPDYAALYFQKMKANQKDFFSPEQVYRDIFEQVDGEYSKKIFRENEQNSWMDDEQFLPSLAKVHKDFVEYISSGKISKISDCADTHKKAVKIKKDKKFD